MKNVTFTKDGYQDKTVRVNYWQTSTETVQVPSFNEETGEETLVPSEQTVTKLLFCERLSWANDESELDSVIEQKRSSL